MSSEIKILFYIIAGILYIISTAYLKEKKKQGERNVTRKPVDTKTAEDIFRELKKALTPPEEMVEEPKPMEKRPALKKQRQPEIFSRVNDLKPKETKPVENTLFEEAHFTPHKEIGTPESKESESFKPEIDFSETDPRKAFIYGEIFNRPRY